MERAGNYPIIRVMNGSRNIFITETIAFYVNSSEITLLRDSLAIELNKYLRVNH